MVTVRLTMVTVLEVTVKVAVVLPAGTTMEEGTVATVVLLLDNDTLAPPLGAGPESVTVAIDGLPPRTDVGFSETVDGVGLATVKVPVLVAPLRVAVMVTVVFDDTGLVVTENVDDVVFAAMVTLAGVPATVALLSDSPTMTPPAGAGALRVTVPVTEVPPITLFGLTLTDASSGLRVKAVVRVDPL
jgi:hypothetical protein